jgi:hypothetical protein
MGSLRAAMIWAWSEVVINFIHKPPALFNNSSIVSIQSHWGI